MNKYDFQFIWTLRGLLESPYDTIGCKVRPVYADGSPAHTRFINHHIETYDLQRDGLPISTLRPIAIKLAIKEYLAFFQDQTSELKVLREKYGINYWDQWEVENSGTIGQRYGATIKRYDLMNKLLDGIKNDPLSRRHIIDLYQYADFEATSGLYPCQFLHIFTVRGEFLDLMTVIRSSDFLVAGDINRIQAIALLHMVAKSCGYKVGQFTHVTNNLHIYTNQFEAAQTLIDRFESEPKGNGTVLPNPHMELIGEKDFYDWTIDDFQITGYSSPYSQIKFELAV